MAGAFCGQAAHPQPSNNNNLPSAAASLPAGITEKEAKTLAKHFEDPKFRELFQEYAREIADPKARAEQDAYLRQMEAEGQLESMYGKGTQVLQPQPGFVIKTKTADGAHRVYINVCVCPKVEPLVLEEAPAGNRLGRHLQLPIMLARRECREGRTAEGVAFKTWDLVLHPDSVARCQERPAIHEAVIIMAIERVEEATQIELLRKYKLPAVQYKAVSDEEQGPAVILLRTAPGEGDVVDGRLRPLSESGAGPDAPPGPDTACKAGGSSSRSGFSFGGKGSKHTAAGTHQPAAGEPPISSSTGVRTPEYQIVERARVDLGQTWADTGRGLQASSNTPQALILRVLLPGVESAAGIELNLAAGCVCLEVPGKFSLRLPLKHSIKEEQATAHYDVRKQQMTLTLPVAQPQAAPAQTEQPQQPQAEEPAQSTADTPAVVEPLPDGGEEASAAACTLLDQPAAATPTQPGSACEPEPAGKTPNQLLWEALHEALPSETAAAAGSAGGTDTTAAEAAPQQDTHQPAEQQQEQQTAMRAAPLPAAPLRPRLSSSHVCASDFV